MSKQGSGKATIIDGNTISTPDLINLIIDSYTTELNSQTLFHKQVNFDETATFNENVNFGELTGSSNAYACLTSVGTLYRSQTPCV